MYPRNYPHLWFSWPFQLDLITLKISQYKGTQQNSLIFYTFKTWLSKKTSSQHNFKISQEPVPVFSSSTYFNRKANFFLKSLSLQKKAIFRQNFVKSHEQFSVFVFLLYWFQNFKKKTYNFLFPFTWWIDFNSPQKSCKINYFDGGRGASDGGHQTVNNGIVPEMLSM